MKQTDEKNVIFVCTGNTCRSPMAEAIFRYEAKRRGLAVSVCPAGTEADERGRMNINSLRTLANHGLSIENFSPTQLTLEMVDKAFAVVCMTERHRDVVKNAYARWKAVPVEDVKTVHAYSDFCGYSIPDPYGMPIEEYERTYVALEGGMSAIIGKLFATVESQKTKKSGGEATKKSGGEATKKSGGKSTKKSSGKQMEIPIDVPMETKKKKTRKTGEGTRKRADSASASGEKSATTSATDGKASGEKKKTATRKSVPKKE